MTKRLKRALLTEELYALTEDTLSALILHQMLYWCMRTKDVDKYLAEEKERGHDHQVDPSHGWVYKSAEELAEEIMTDVSRQTVSRRLSDLVDKGWLDRRNNPAFAWDRTLQYRPNLPKIQQGLEALGYTLATIMHEHFPLVFESGAHGGQPIVHDGHSMVHDEQSNASCEQAIPEITSEITSESTAKTLDSANAESPQAEGALEPTKRRKRRVTEWERHRWDLGKFFSEKTGIPIPEKGDGLYGQMQKMWWGPLKTIYTLAGKDVPRATQLIGRAIQHSRDNNLAIASPQSIQKVAIVVETQPTDKKPTTKAERTVNETNAAIERYRQRRGIGGNSRNDSEDVSFASGSVAHPAGSGFDPNRV